jgi:hypothetical protein
VGKGGPDASILIAAHDRPCPPRVPVVGTAGRASRSN